MVTHIWDYNGDSAQMASELAVCVCVCGRGRKGAAMILLLFSALDPVTGLGLGRGGLFSVWFRAFGILKIA